jgi:hypothetical protein
MERRMPTLRWLPAWALILAADSAAARPPVRLDDGRILMAMMTNTAPCLKAFIGFDIGKTGPAKDDPIVRASDYCPAAEPVDPERELVVEGVDRRGRRLFVALSDDPRWHIYEGADAQGNIRLLRRGRDPDPSTYVDFRAPIDDRLARLLIWQVDEDAKGRIIATIIWTPVKPRQ